MVPQMTGLAITRPNGIATGDGLPVPPTLALRPTPVAAAGRSSFTIQTHGTSQSRPPRPITTNIIRQSYAAISHAASGVPMAGPILVPVM
jgi:hypothetical protein